MKKTKVRNFYEEIPKPKDKEKNNPNFHVHGIEIPFRMLIVGGSGSMKTNSALDILEKFEETFEQVTVVCRNKDEPLYNLLADSLEPSQLTMIEIENNDLSKIPTLSGQNSDSPHKLVIFDDLCLIKDQQKIEEFFIRARKLNISCMYLTQSYYKSPKVVRINCNYVLFKKIDCARDLHMILSEYSLGITLPELERLHAYCTNDKLDWLMLNMQNEIDKRFCHNYEIIDPRTMHPIVEHEEKELSHKKHKPYEEEEKKEPYSGFSNDLTGFQNLSESELLDLLKRYG